MGQHLVDVTPESNSITMIVHTVLTSRSLGFVGTDHYPVVIAARGPDRLIIRYRLQRCVSRTKGIKETTILLIEAHLSNREPLAWPIGFGLHTPQDPFVQWLKRGNSSLVNSPY